nr:hypothetical protein [Tanacetum cinerariifolium]
MVFGVLLDFLESFIDPSHSSSLFSVSQNSVLSDVVDESCVPSGSSLSAVTEEIVAYEKENDEIHPVKSVAERKRWFSCLFMSAFCESWHIMQAYFCVFKNANVEMIPQQYILRRRTKNLIPGALRNKRNRYGAFVEKLKSLKKEVEADCPNPLLKNKTNNLEQLVGVSKPPAVDVNNPTVGSTKGRKNRTCPRRFKVQDEVLVQKEVCQEEVVVQKEVCQKEVVQEKVDLAEDEEELVEEDEDLINE